MRTTLKRIDVGSAFRVGFVLYAVMFAIFGLLFVLLQGWLLSLFSSGVSIDAPNFNSTLLFGTGVLSLLCFYGVGIVAAAIGGGITFSLVAFFYNRTANWIGGLKIELEIEESDLMLDDLEREMSKRKRDEL